MIKEYEIKGTTVKVCYGEDMLEPIIRLSRCKVSENDIIFGSDIIIPEDVIIAMYHHCVWISNDESEAYFLMCSSELPSSISHLSDKLFFAPNRYTVLMPKGGLHVDFNGLSRFLLWYEKLYGDEDSFYKRIINAVGETSMLHVVNISTCEIESLFIEESVLSRSVYTSLNGFISGFLFEVDIHISNDRLGGVFHVREIRGDEIIFTNMTLGWLKTYSFKCAPKRMAACSSAFLTLDAANAELLRLRDEIKDRLDENVDKLKSKMQKILAKIRMLDGLK